jgi:hypothetical protein
LANGDGETKARPATDDLGGDDRLIYGGQSPVLRWRRRFADGYDIADFVWSRDGKRPAVAQR